MQFSISTTDEVLLPQSGLALVGALLQDTKLRQRIDTLEVAGCLRPAVKHGDVLVAAIGLLCLGKSDFSDIEALREDEFFRLSLGLRQIPAEPTLRQRLDAMRDACGPILREESALLLRKHARKLTPCHGQWVALDVDVSPFDNSGTKKEGVSWTYKEVIALYHAHGTSEQYHSEIKTDLDLERLPSGKFATNATMLSLGLVAYNLLRLCGQGALKEQRRLPAEERAPLQKKVFRRRLRSVIQDLMYLAAQLVRHAHRWQVVFWRNSPWGATWRGLYARFAGAPGVRSG